MVKQYEKLKGTPMVKQYEKGMLEFMSQELYQVSL